MGYVDMQYTGPLWDNNVPPPLNATNLLDISHALEAVNVTQQERTSLGAQETDKLGQILTVLNSKIGNLEDSVEQIQTVLEKKGTLGVEAGSYVGNDQATVIVNFTHPVKFMLIQGKVPDGNYYCSIICNTFNEYVVLHGYTGRMWATTYNVSFSNSDKSVSIGGYNVSTNQYQYFGIVDLST